MLEARRSFAFTFIVLVAVLGVPRSTAAKNASALEQPGSRIAARGGASADRGELAPAWRAIPAPSLEHPVAVLDARRNRIIAMDSDRYAEDPESIRIWSLPLDGTSGWSEVLAGEPTPFPRVNFSAILDPRRNRLLVFGGGRSALDGQTPRVDLLNDVWQLTLSGKPTWSALPVEGEPPPATAQVIYDPVDDAMIVLGQVDPLANRTDVWSLSLSGAPAWRPLAVSGVSPGNQAGGVVTYDPVRHRILFMCIVELWALSLDGVPAWTQLPDPVFSTGQTLTYVPDGDRLILYGGFHDFAGGQISNPRGAWGLSLSGTPEWTELEPAGELPEFHLYHAALYDPAVHRMLVVGGVGPAGPETWQLSLVGGEAWSRLFGTRALPAERVDPSAVYDSSRRRMIVFGGLSTDPYSASSHPLDDLWWLPLEGRGGWVKAGHRRGAPLPAARSGQSAIYDPVRDRMIVFGGEVEDLDNGRLTSSLLAASFSDAGPDQAEWSAIEPPGERPDDRKFQRAVYDPIGDRMIVFGGTSGSSGRALDDVWALSLTGMPSWTELHPAGRGPGVRSAHSVAYDPHGHRVLVFGGDDGTRVRGDTWALTLNEHPFWSLVMGESDPRLARTFAGAVYDEVGRQLVIWGGHQALAGADVGDAWALALEGKPAWRLLEAANAPPPGREGHTAIYDSERGQMVVFGGTPARASKESLNDTWALPLGLSGRRSVEDRETIAASPTPTATWLGARLEGPRPNPSTGLSELSFTLVREGRVVVSVFDASGRVVRSLAHATYPAGAHLVSWDGRDGTGRRLSAGLYFIRLEAAGATSTHRIALGP